MNGSCYRTNSPPVVYETVEGETIAVNLETGSYYDLNEVGGYILALFEAGAAVSEVTGDLATCLDTDLATLEPAVEGFVQRLADERLILPLSSGAGAGLSRLTGGLEPPERYREPTLNKHSDMEELLLLDPVHQVGEAGWPSPR